MIGETESNDQQAFQTELEQLRQDYKKLNQEYKKQGRVLDSLQKQLERNRVAAAAKDNLRNIIMAKRSELERYMNLLLGNCPDIILLFDQDSRIVYCTESFLQRCGIPAFGMIAGRYCRELLTPYATPRFLDRMEEVYTRAFAEKQAMDFVETADFERLGRPRNYSIQITPMLGEDGMVEGSMAFFYDTTELMKAQREAERANTAKSDFLATVSHEIRTPMNAIIGVSNMLKDTGLGETQQGYLKSIQKSSHVLLNLINDILDFSKIEAGKLELVRDYFSLGSLLGHLQSMFEPMFQQKGLHLFCQFAPHLPEAVLGDENRIRQVLMNVLNNALKYTEKGSVVFRVDVEEGNLIRFDVEDTGVGIRKEAINRLFTAFEQLDLVKNKNIVGTGLGLAITKQLCRLMGGTISVQSEYGKGSCFTVRLSLPVGTTADLPAEQRAEAIRFIAPGVWVLLVDDIEINLEIAAYMLEPFQIQSDLASSGRQAVEKAGQKHYDIIFMDHMMPEMDGIEAAQIIRSMGGYAAEVPIVALTANAVSGAVEMFLQNGFNSFLSKPMADVALSDCLLKCLPKEKVVMQ